ncbi:MAG: AzlD domain-containing protein [Pseudomonadota bacterium]
MTASNATIWLVIVLLGLGTFLIRFSFLGLIGSRKMPDWILRHLRYTAVAFLPAIAAPLVVWPPATGGMTDPARLAAGITTLIIGLWTKNLFAAFFAGGAVLLGWQMLPL